MGVSVLEHRTNEEILEDATVEQIVAVMRRGLEWFGHVIRRDEQKNQSSCRNKDRWEAPWRKTDVAMERHCQKGPESLERQSGMGQYLLPHTTVCSP